MIEGFELVAERQYRHVQTDLLFTLVEGSSFTFGMTNQEEEQLRNYSPHVDSVIVEQFHSESLQHCIPNQTIQLNPFLIADFPLTVQFVIEHWGFADDQMSDTGAGYVPNSETVIPLLQDLGFRLPSETEWEFCHRQFCPISGLPDEQMLQMEPGATIGAFGSYDEICADVWHPSLTSIPENGQPRVGAGPRTIRGGAASLWPWQGCGEWLGLLPFFRYPEDQHHFLSVRPAVSIRIDI